MVVRMRHTRAHTRNRRSHHGLVARSFSVCKCGADAIAHKACLACGHYKGKEVINVSAKELKKEAKRKAKKGN